MGSLIAFLISKGVSTRFARPLAYAVLILGLVAFLALGKCAYDRSVIKRHTAQQEAAVAKADRKADAKAAEQRRVDDARLTTESQEIRETINDAKQTGADPRAAYYRCLGLQQAARRDHKSPAKC